MEWAAASHVFGRFGANGWADRASQALTVSARPPAPPRKQVDCIFRSDGDTRTVTFEGQTALIRDLVGLRYLERLLAEPDREFHVLDLIAVERGSAPRQRHADSEAGTQEAGHAGCHLDAEAREAYRRRLVEIDEDIQDATLDNDLGRIALAEADRDFLIRELSRAVGLGGRPRRALSTTERARTSVTRTLRYAITRIAEHHPVLGQHLQQAVATGTYCVYRPDPRLPAHWEV